MKHILFTIIALLFATSGLFAQGGAPAAFGIPTEYFYNLSPYSNADMSTEYVDGIKTYRSKDRDEGMVVGEPFLDPEFKEGAIYFSDSTKLVDIKLRYNVFMDKMDIVFEGDTFGIQPSYRMVGLQVGDRLFMNSLMYDKWTREFKYGYLEVLADGKLKLLKQYIKSYTFNSFTTKYNGGGGDRNYHYVDKQKLFYKTGIASAIELKKRKKKILQIFEDEAERVEEYAEENKLNFRNEDDLKELFEYYNSL
jgi:hypothetical protein